MNNQNSNESFEKLLLEEYNHMAESFLKNEELGERRVDFFITLTAAVPVALIAILKNEIGLQDGKVYLIFFGGFTALLLFGIITLVRMTHRNIETDKFLNAVARIRQYFVKQNDEEKLLYLYFDPYEEHHHEREKIFNFGKGGLVEMVACINSLIVSALLTLLTLFMIWTFCPDLFKIDNYPLLLIFPVIIFSLGAWGTQMQYVMKKYDNECPK